MIDVAACVNATTNSDDNDNGGPVRTIRFLYMIFGNVDGFILQLNIL